MTQDYEPIEITESTPEPEEYGTFLVLHGTTVLYVANHMASPVDSYWTDAEGEDCHWSDILNDESGRGTTIQSLAAHDAQIRAEGLKLTDEQLDFAIRHMKGEHSKSRVIEREMLQQALTVIAGDKNEGHES